MEFLEGLGKQISEVRMGTIIPVKCAAVYLELSHPYTVIRLILLSLFVPLLSRR